MCCIHVIIVVLDPDAFRLSGYVSYANWYYSVTYCSVPLLSLPCVVWGFVWGWIISAFGGRFCFRVAVGGASVVAYICWITLDDV